MEQARMFLAIALSFLVFFLWNLFFVDKEETLPVDTDPKPVERVQSSGEREEKEQEVRTPAPTETGDAEPSYGGRAREPRKLDLTTPLYQATLSEEQGRFQRFVLSNYSENAGKDSPPKRLLSKENPLGTFLLAFDGNGLSGLDQAMFTCDTEAERIEVTGKAKQIRYHWQSKEGVKIVKTFTFDPGSYLIGLDVKIVNGSGGPLTGELSVVMNKYWMASQQSYGFTGPCALIQKRLEEIAVDDIGEKNPVKGEIGWVTILERYFRSSIIPKNISESRIQLRLDEESHILTTAHTRPSETIGQGEERLFSYYLYMGPKSVSVLRKVEHNLDLAVNFGFFDFIAKPCLWLMNFLYHYIPNYGIAIIVLTVLIKILFWPLGNKSYKSMNEMKKLQPLMAEIREKYKDDKKRMNEEVMGLYKTYKINPLGGCLPMVAQIPVFFALYQMLYGAIELRHAPFIGWINDLSAPDRLMDFGQYGISIPLMEPPYGIPVLTIIMGATMLIQQNLQPPAGDPTQAKMMMLMPIVFTVIFINFSSGLVLYWLVNNILSIAQQYYVSRKNA